MLRYGIVDGQSLWTGGLLALKGRSGGIGDFLGCGRSLREPGGRTVDEHFGFVWLSDKRLREEERGSTKIKDEEKVGWVNEGKKVEFDYLMKGMWSRSINALINTRASTPLYIVLCSLIC